jgi:hypothetical protein
MLRYVLFDIPAVTLDLSLDKPEISSNTTGLLSGTAQYFINNEKPSHIPILLVLLTETFPHRP